MNRFLIALFTLATLSSFGQNIIKPAPLVKPYNIAWDQTARPVSDVEKARWNAGTGSGGSSTGIIYWSSIPDRPLVFPAAPHAHSVGDVIGLQNALNLKLDNTDIRLTNARTPLAHTHVVNEIGGLFATLTDLSNAQTSNAAGVNSVSTTAGQLGQQLASLQGQVNALASGGSSGGSAYAGNALVIVDFNSLGAGRGSSHEITSPDDYSPGPFAVTMMNSLVSQFPSATFVKKNFSVSGRQTPTMISQSSQVDNLFNPALYDRQIIVCGEITNHIADGGATAQQAIDSYVSYCKARRAKGFTVIATTVLPRTSFFGSGISAAEFENRRTVVNTYLRLHYLEFADQLGDIASLTGLVFNDGTHLNDAGYVVVGNYLSNKAAPLLRTGFNPQSIAFLLSGTTTTANNTTVTSSTGTSGTTTTGTSTSAVLSLRGQGTNNSTAIVDDAGHTVTVSGNARISTAQFKFGTSSIYLDGSAGTFLSLASSADFNFGTGDVTMELWLYKTSNGSGYPGLITRGDNSSNQFALCFPSAGNRPELFVYTGSYQPQGLNVNTDVSLNTWNHLALVSKDGVRKFYLNGVLVGTASGTLSLETNNANKPLYVGYLPAVGGSTGDVLTGYLHARITKAALYTTNFTPPASF